MPRLENWSITSSQCSPYTAPECIERRLQGTVYEHTLLEDGKFVCTSRVIKIDMLKMEAQTLNNTYSLGEMDAEYKKWYEDYKKENH